MMASTPASALWWPGVPLALGAAALFGLAAPLSKLLLDNISPQLLAGTLYLGSGAGLLAAWSMRHRLRFPEEAPLRRRDVPTMAAIVLFGGVLGPLLLMLGLVRTPASSASLLLNLEGVFTLAGAWLVYRENVDLRVGIGAVAVVAGAVLLSLPRGEAAGFGAGSVLVIGACLAWAIDNNLTRRISGSDPVQIAGIKGLAAGTVNVALAALAGSALPGGGALAAAALLGLLGYGVSLTLFVLALRHLGTARTGAYFSTAPFVGAVVAVTALGEPVSWPLLAAGALMLVGVALHLMERHGHLHVHEPLDHMHPHVHDAHHQHSHSPEDPAGEPHTHAHHHAVLKHVHPHYPDIHHRHEH